MSVNLFDANFYRAANADLANLNDTEILSHFQTFGLNEGRSFSPFANLRFYKDNNADLANLDNRQLFEHLQNLGVREGRNFSQYVDLDFYLANNGDLKNAFGNNKEQALEHLRSFGLKEKRKVSQFFDVDFYLQNNPDVNIAFKGDRVQAFQHFERFGLDEKRKFSIALDIDYYRRMNADLSRANLSDRQLYNHFQQFGVNEGRASSPFLNLAYYLDNNQDLRSAGFNRQQAYRHFVAKGLQEARNANFKNNTIFSGIAAGDATENSAILWTRTADATTNTGKVSDLMVQVSTDPQFNSIESAFVDRTKGDRDYTLKLDNTFLQSNTRYYYRFLAPGGEISLVGTFKTAPNKTDRSPLRMAFSADTAGEWRPYNISKDFDKQNFDFFVYLGDTIYETVSGNPSIGIPISPPTADPFTNTNQALIDYRRKYLENLEPVRAGGFPGLEKFYASQGNYTLLDNHELGDKQFANGGAPAGTPVGAGVDATNPIYDVNTTGAFINKTPGFEAVLQPYLEYQPVREVKISAPNDPRTDGTHKLYFAQQWGANAVFVNVDDRSYRDIRMRRTATDGRIVDDIGDRANNPNRTILGATQLNWLKQTLLQAKNDGVTWKIVAVSTPIDENASTSGNKIIPLDTGKTWIGGYRSERNDLLKFIDDNNIENVVFLSADDHENRINELTYTDPVTGSRVRIPKTLSIVGGPYGAFGPGLITDRSFNNIKSLADGIVAQQQPKGVDPLGLDPQFPGLKNVYREGDPNADTLRQPVDFYSPDTFNYVTLDVSGDGKKLSVNTYGIDAYPVNSFPELDRIDTVRRILGFDIESGL